MIKGGVIVRKALFVFIGIFGFILVFCISGLISYYLFPDSLGSNTPDNVFNGEDAMAQINLTGSKTTDNEVPGAAPQAEEELTIVTPSLDRTQALVRRGTIADILPGTNAQPTDVTEFAYAEEPEAEAEEEKNVSGGAAAQSGGSGQTGSSSASTNTGGNKPSSQEAPEAQQQEVQQPEAPQAEAPQQEAQQETPQTPQLNPGIQTSDTGL